MKKGEERGKKKSKKRTPHLLVEGMGKEKNMFTTAFPSFLFCYYLTLSYLISPYLFFFLKGHERGARNGRGGERRKRKEEKEKGGKETPLPSPFGREW